MLLKCLRETATQVLTVILFTVAMGLGSLQATAQLAGKIADKPLVVGYARNISPARIMEYAKNLTEQLSIGKSMREAITAESQQERLEHIAPKVQVPLYGVAIYMVSGLIPSFETVSFQQVVDEADARRLVTGRKQQFGSQGIMEELPNGCFKVQYSFTSSSPLPPGTDETQFANDDANAQQRGVQVIRKVVEKDGLKYLEHGQIMTSLFRYHDSVLYEANFEELFEMQLPSAEAISSGVNGSTDLGFNAYLDRIPQGLRQLGWSMLTAAVGTQLQQRDDEPDSQYNMRKSTGDLGLTLIQAALFDVDSSDGWATFANVDDGSLRGELKVRARNNSQLTKQLLDAVGTSRFAPILGDNAAATLHLCVRLPQEASSAFQATGTWLAETLASEFKNDAAMIAAGTTLAETLTGLGEHRNVEFFLKTGWTAESGGVFYGGLQLVENPQLLPGLHHLLTHLPNEAPGIEQMITLEERQGMQVIVIRPPAEAVEEFKASAGASITHIYLAHENSCLWFAAGTENASEIIRQSVARCTEHTRAARTPLISGRIDMERWLSYPQDDPAGIAQMPHWLDENAWWFPPSPFGIGFGGQQGKPHPIMQPVFDLGGSQQAGFSLEADEGGILLQASLGEALANHMVARMIDAQESMMVKMQEQRDTMQLKETEALKQAQKQVLEPPKN